jgi:penicillin-binding protein 1C
VRKIKSLLPLVPIAVSVVLILTLVSLILILKDLPAPATLTNKPIPQTTKILDRNGQLLYNIYVSENRTIIPAADIPASVKQATIAIEDKDFYKHGGVNFVGGILRALRDNLTGQPLEGGSTITQQLVKKGLLTDERTVSRKIREAILAFWTEKIYTKDQILAMYINRIPYGGTAYGIEEAAQIYFDKHAKDLDLAESALLAGLPQAPTYYSPFGTDPNRAIARQHQVLERMLEDGDIDAAQKETAENETLRFASPSAGIKAPHFVAYVQELLVKKYGEDTVENGGLKVTTSLDLDLQEAAQASLSAEVAKQVKLKVGNGAALVTRPGTGEILAMVGSRDYYATDSGKVNVTLAKRSPGSSIKPLNYALGFLKGTTTPATAWIDAPFCFPPFAGKSYCPQNYDGKFHGVVQTRFALGDSLNIPAVKELALNTVPDFIATASAMGITTFNDDPSRYGYSLTLGGGEVQMTDMAVAYGVFANAGRRQNLTPILKVEDAQGKVLEDNTSHSSLVTSNSPWDGSQPWIPHDNFVLPSEVTYLISHILLDDGARSQTFGAGSILNIPGKVVSVKTGTTEDKRDNWTIGYTPSVLVAVWVGNNDNSPMSPYLESGDTGAAPIWHNIISFILKNQPTEWPKKPDSIVFEQVCSLSGLLPNNDCPTRGEYFIKAFAPRDKDNVWNQKHQVLVYKDSHKQPKPSDKPTPDQLTQEDHLVISDPAQKDFCADCAL